MSNNKKLVKHTKYLKVIFYTECLLLFFLPWDTFFKFNLLGYNLRLTQILTIVLIGLATPIILKARNNWLKIPWILLIIFLFICLVSAIFSLHQLKALEATIYYTLNILLVFTIAITYKPQFRKTFTAIILASGAIAALFALYQFVGDFAGLANSTTLLLERYSKVVFGYPRIQGFSNEPLFLANYLFLPLGISLAYVIFDKRIMWKLLSLFFSTVIFLTVARGAIISLIIISTGLVAWLCVGSKYKKALTVIAVIVFSALVATSAIFVGSALSKQIDNSNTASSQLTSNVSDNGVGVNTTSQNLSNQLSSPENDVSIVGRLDAMKQSLSLSTKSIVYGLGPGNARYYLAEKNSIDPTTKVLPSVSNQPLELLVETGIVGLLSFIGFIIYALAFACKKLKQIPLNQKPWALALIITTLLISLQYFTFSTLFLTHVWVVLGLLAALSMQNSNKG